MTGNVRRNLSGRRRPGLTIRFPQVSVLTSAWTRATALRICIGRCRLWAACLAWSGDGAGGNSVGCQHSADTLVTYEALVNTLACTRNVKRITFRAITRAATTQPSSTAGLAYIRVHYSRDNLYVCSLLEMRLQEARTKTRSIE